MEILKNLTEPELNDLRDLFEKHRQKSLDRKEFRRALRAASKGKQLPFRITKAYLNHLFSSVDVIGDERVTWADFSMYVVEQARNAAAEITVPYKDQMWTSHQRQRGGSPNGNDMCSSSSSSDDDDDDELQSRRQDELAQSCKDDGKRLMEEMANVRRYHIDNLQVNPLGARILDMRLLPRTTRVVKVTENLKGQRTLTLHEDAEKFPVIGALPRRIEPFSTWEYIPSTGGIINSSTLTAAYNNGLLQLFRLPDPGICERRSEFLECVKSLHTPDTQTALQWSSLYGRLVMGSRNGIVSVWDVDTDRVASQERLHSQAITACRMRTNMLFTASLDRFDSVKATDLEKAVVVYSFSDHIIGGALRLEVDHEYIISTGCESKIVLRAVQAPNATFSNLYDCVAPHQGRLTAVQRIPATPLLLSGDSKGNVKVWDLRMNSCLQTFSATSLGYVKKTKKTNASNSNNNNNNNNGHPGEERGDEDPQQVLSICPLPKLGLINVSTGSHRFTLTALDAAFPDRVDDEIPCRFVKVPNSSQILTVHGTYFKMWNVTTGHLIYTSSMKAIQGDVTACALVEPLKRQILLGSISGDLKGFTVSLGKRIFNFSPALRDADFIRKDNPIISLDTIPNFRDQPVPYVIVTYKDSVVLLPISTGARTSSVVRLHVVNNLLEEDTHTIKETQFRERQLFVSLSNNTVHLVDLHFNTVTATYRLPTTDLDNIHVAITTEGSFRRVESSFASKRRMHASVIQSFFLAADSRGNVMCGKGVQLNNLEDMQRNKSMNRSILGCWNTGVPDSWQWGGRSRGGRRRRSKSVIAEEEENKHNHNNTSGTRTNADPDGDVFLPRIPPDASPAITHMHFFSLFCCLVTGDERGNVKLWDLCGVFSKSGGVSERDGRQQTSAAHPSTPFMPSPSTRRIDWGSDRSQTSLAAYSSPLGVSMSDRSGGSYPPVLINEWHAHSHGFTCLDGLEHPHLMLPVVVTSGPDHHLLMWSCDGYAIGSLATGRQIDDTSGGRRFGLLPYVFQQSPADVISKWEKFLDYYRMSRHTTEPVEMEEELLLRPQSDAFNVLNPDHDLPAMDRGFSLSLAEGEPSPAMALPAVVEVPHGPQLPPTIVSPGPPPPHHPLLSRSLLRSPSVLAEDDTALYVTEPLMQMPLPSHLQPFHFTSRAPGALERTSAPRNSFAAMTSSSPRAINDIRSEVTASSTEDRPVAFTPTGWPRDSDGSAGSTGSVGQQSGNKGGGGFDIIQPQFRFNARARRPRLFRLARTGVCIKSIVSSPSSRASEHHLPQLGTHPEAASARHPVLRRGRSHLQRMHSSSSSATTNTAVTTSAERTGSGSGSGGQNGQLPPLSAPVAPPRHSAGHDLGNGVLEVRVRQQSVLDTTGRGLMAMDNKAEERGPTPTKAGPTRLLPRQEAIPEVSPRMIHEEYDITVNVRGRVVENTRRGMRSGKDMSKPSTLARAEQQPPPPQQTPILIVIIIIINIVGWGASANGAHVTHYVEADNRISLHALLHLLLLLLLYIYIYIYIYIYKKKKKKKKKKKREPKIIITSPALLCL
eukprot:gene6517-4694_t